MRKILIAAVLAFLTAGFLFAGQGRTVRVISESADIHIEPTRSSSIIGKVKQGDVLRLFDTGAGEKSWYYISFYSQEKWATITGFIEARWVELVEPEPEAAAEAPVGEKKPPEESVVKEPIPPRGKVPARRPKSGEKPPAAEKAGESAAVKSEPEAAEVEALSPEVPPVEFAGRLRVKEGGGIIRATNSPDARVILEVPQGAEMDVTSLHGQWFRVKYPRQDGIVLIGFILRDQVDLVEGEIPEAPPPPESPPEGIRPEEEKPFTPPAGPPVEEEEEKMVTGEPELPPEPPEPPPAVRVPGFETPRLGLRLGISGVFPSAGEYASALAPSGALLLRFHRNFGIELQALRFKSAVEARDGGLSAGDWTVTPLLFSAVGRYPLKHGITPYVVIGGGYAFSSFDLGSDLVDTWSELGFEVAESVENAFVFQAGAGVDYRLPGDILLNLDVRYLGLKTEGNWSLVDSYTGLESTGALPDLNMGSLLFTLGIKIFVNLF